MAQAPGTNTTAQHKPDQGTVQATPPLWLQPMVSHSGPLFGHTPPHITYHSSTHSALLWLLVTEPFLCLAAVPLFLWLLLPLALQLWSVWSGCTEESTEGFEGGSENTHRQESVQGGADFSCSVPAHRYTHSQRSHHSSTQWQGGTAASVKAQAASPSSPSSPSSSSRGSRSKRTALLLTLLPCALSLCCGFSLIQGARSYAALMHDSLPAAKPVVSVLHTLLLCAVGVLIAADLCMLWGVLRSLARSACAQHTRSKRVSSGGGKDVNSSLLQTWWERITRSTAPTALLCAAVLLVTLSAGMRVGHAIVQLLLPLHHAPPTPSVSFKAWEDSMLQRSAPTLGVLLYLQGLFLR